VRYLSFFLAVYLMSCHTRGTLPSDSTERRNLQSVSASVPFNATPPHVANVKGGVPSVVLANGFGPVRPERERRQLIGVGFVTYDSAGEGSYTPFVLQEFDALSPEWQIVLGEMVAGEIRRVWLPNDGKVKVYDIELQSIGDSRRR